jgi:hypothetical protein
MKPNKKSPQKPRRKLFKKNVDLFIKQRKVKRMTDALKNDRLEILKRKCEEDIQVKERELAELKIKLRNLNLFAQESETLDNKYANMGTTDAVLDAVNSLCEEGAVGGRVTAALVRNYLLAHGFRSNAENFEVALSITLNRLAQSGRISASVGFRGRRFYRPRRRFGRIALRLLKAK